MWDDDFQCCSTTWAFMNIQWVCYCFYLCYSLLYASQRSFHYSFCGFHWSVCLEEECKNVFIFIFFTLFDVSYDELWLLKVENYSLAKSLVVTLHCLSLPLMYDNLVFSKNSKKKLLCMLMVYRNWDGPKAKDLVMMMSQCSVLRVSEVLNKFPWSF